MTPPKRRQFFENLSVAEMIAVLICTTIGGGGGSAGYIFLREPPPMAVEATLNSLAGEVLLLRQANTQMAEQLNQIRLDLAYLPPTEWRERIRANERWRWDHDH